MLRFGMVDTCMHSMQNQCMVTCLRISCKIDTTHDFRLTCKGVQISQVQRTGETSGMMVQVTIHRSTANSIARDCKTTQIIAPTPHADAEACHGYTVTSGQHSTTLREALLVQVILEVCIVQPQLQLIGPCPDSNVKLLSAPHHVLVLALPQVLLLCV